MTEIEMELSKIMSKTSSKDCELDEYDTMSDKEKWESFRNRRLLWFVNTLIHAFGYALVFQYIDGYLIVTPERVRYRGFPEEVNTEGYKKLSKYMCEAGEDLLKEAED